MSTVTTRVPVRSDLAGGTLDLWPLYLFHPGARTVNVAVSFHAECEVAALSDSAIELHIGDDQYQRRYDSVQELARDPRAALIYRAIEHFKLPGIRLHTRTDVPRGSGLGGSSAMAVAIVRALAEIAEEPVDGDALIALVRDLETRLLKLPAGIQDYYPAVYGGLASLRLDPGAVTRQLLRLPLPDLASHFVLHYTEVSHFSGTNNWEIYKRHIDGDENVFKSMRRIAEISAEMERALAAADLPSAGAALGEEWKARKELIDGVSTPEVDAAIDAAIKAGAWGGKVCGAGGGGCVVILTPPQRKPAVLKALASVPGRTLDAQPVPYGLELELEPQKQTPFLFVEKPTRFRGEPIDQLYLVTSRKGAYQPFALVEAAVNFRDARRATDVTIARTFVAPIHDREERVQWDLSLATDPERLKLTAIPDPKREFKVRSDSNELLTATAEGLESVRQFLQETEKMTLFHNDALGVYSEPGESKRDFIQRCMGLAGVQIETEAERLEKTFRRRIDQMIQREEREKRELDEHENPVQESAREVNIAWGQTLYNITSGKPGRSERPGSPREGDYMEEISALQKSWNRELDAVRDELSSRARQVEEITLTPSRKNIEIRKFVLLWAPGRESLQRMARKTRKPRNQSG